MKYDELIDIRYVYFFHQLTVPKKYFFLDLIDLDMNMNEILLD